MSVDGFSLFSHDGGMPDGPALAELPLPFARCDDNLGETGWLETDLNEWITASGLAQALPSLRRARASGYALLSCLNYPAASPDHLRLISRYFAFYFECDTSCVERPATEGRLTEVASEILRWSTQIQYSQRPPPSSTGRHLEVLHSIGEQLHRLAIAAQAERVHRGERDYLLGAACEAAYLAQGTLPTFAEYRDLREHTATVGWHLALVEITGGFEVPGRVRRRSDVLAATRTMGLLLGLINDMASWRKESRTSPRALNFPNVIARERGCTLLEAAHETAGMTAVESQRFYDQTEQLIREGGALGRWAGGARHCVAGWHRWHTLSERFAIDSATDRDQ
ncbi:hypothetical protein [Amycolatopsis sp. NPDC052450]|uniref:terpene synthase family protein n=1 Tax=Amycolatopsis sp. NPDC052450 TaxID=3363937 RepID=UPI0037C7F167